MSFPTQRPPEVATFLVEHYWPGITPERFEAAAGRLRRAAAQLVDDGARIEFLHSTLVPGDEAAFCVFEAESQAVVVEAYQRARIPYERVLDAFEAAARESSSTTPKEKEET